MWYHQVDILQTVSVCCNNLKLAHYFQHWSCIIYNHKGIWIYYVILIYIYSLCTYKAYQLLNILPTAQTFLFFVEEAGARMEKQQKSENMEPTQQQRPLSQCRWNWHLIGSASKVCKIRCSKTCNHPYFKGEHTFIMNKWLRLCILHRYSKCIFYQIIDTLIPFLLLTAPSPSSFSVPVCSDWFSRQKIPAKNRISCQNAMGWYVQLWLPC